MNAIATPIPDPLPRAEVPQVAPDERTRPAFRPLAAAAIVALLAVGVLVAWQQSASAPVDHNPAALTAQLDWMFDAALTYPAVDPSGGSGAPPFEALTIDSVTIADPEYGPIIAVGTATLPDGSVEHITYELIVSRSGDHWSVDATRLVPGAASEVTRRGS